MSLTEALPSPLPHSLKFQAGMKMNCSSWKNLQCPLTNSKAAIFLFVIIYLKAPSFLSERFDRLTSIAPILLLSRSSLLAMMRMVSSNFV